MCTDRSVKTAMRGLVATIFIAVLAGCGPSDDAQTLASDDSVSVEATSRPTNLAATAGDSKVSLAWSSQRRASSYNVRRSTTSGGPYTRIANPTSTYYTDTSVSNDTTYFYVVSAIASGREGSNSSQVSAIPRASISTPSVPTNFLATAASTEATLAWNASSGATTYNVKRSTVSGGPYEQVASSSSTSVTDSALTNGTTYYYVVSAANSAGESANSAQVAAKPVAASAAAVSYTTSFDANESPISEGGKWKHNNPWFTNVITSGGNAVGTYPNPQRADKYEDSYAYLGGMGFPPNQYASAHIHKGVTGGYLEVELHLRVTDSANSTQGYECYLHQNGEYVSVARWSGGPMSGPASVSYFASLATANNVAAPKDGDLFEAQIVGNIITVKLAGATLLTVDVSQYDGVVFASGDPGIGFDAGGSGAETASSTFGFSDFSARGL